MATIALPALTSGVGLEGEADHELAGHDPDAGVLADERGELVLVDRRHAPVDVDVDGAEHVGGDLRARRDVVDRLYRGGGVVERGVHEHVAADGDGAERNSRDDAVAASSARTEAARGRVGLTAHGRSPSECDGVSSGDVTEVGPTTRTSS